MSQLKKAPWKKVNKYFEPGALEKLAKEQINVPVKKSTNEKDR